MAKKVDDEVKKTNTFDKSRVEKIVSRIEGYENDLASMRGSYMADCRNVRGDIEEVYKEARCFGIRKKGLRKLLEQRKLERKLEGLAADLEGDDRETYEQLQQAIGGLNGLPLGAAAAAMDKSQTEAGKGKRKPPTAGPSSDDDRDLRGNSQKLAEKGREEEAARQAAENTERLEKGIAPLKGADASGSYKLQ